MWLEPSTSPATAEASVRTLPWILAGLIAGSTPAKALPAWTYDEDNTGQEEWGGLDPAYRLCDEGTAQSPIQIGYTTIESLPPLHFEYTKTTVQAVWDEHTIELRVPSSNTLRIDSELYALTQIRFHSPSEHIIGEDDMRPLEIHLIHKNASGDTLIVAVLARLSEKNTGLEALIAQLPITQPTHFTMDIRQLVPAQHGYYAYRGSLTQPPCSENVEWRVLKDSVTLTRSQMAALSQQLGRNARLTQPVYLRPVMESKE